MDDIHTLVLDAALPSTIEDLKNPTEDYIMKLLTAFLSKFNINMSLITQPTAEQCVVMPYSEDSDIINLINLEAALKQIFEKIYLNDFCITDITSPGQKRHKRQVKYLANFSLYSMRMKSKLNDRIDEIQTKSKQLEDLKNEKTEILESINNIAIHKGKQSSLIEKIEDDIECLHLKQEKINKKESELKLVKNDVEKENLQVKELHASLMAEAGKLSKVINELQSEVVHSPEKYEIRLNELEKQKNSKVKERDIMQEAIQDKKQSIKQIEMKLDGIQRMNNELVKLKIIYEQLKSRKMQHNNIKKQIDLASNTWIESQNKLARHKNDIQAEMNEIQLHREEDITPLRHLYSQLLSEKKLKQTQLETNKAIFNEKCLIRNKLQRDIIKIEEETKTLLNNYQEMYDNEIANEYELREAWKKK